jgi:hypothetical protein
MLLMIYQQDFKVIQKDYKAEGESHRDSSKREDLTHIKKFKDSGLIGCLNESGITSEKYKDELGCGARNSMET